MAVVLVGADQRGAKVRCGCARTFRGKNTTQAKFGKARVCVTQAVFRTAINIAAMCINVTVPDGEYAERCGTVFDCDLRAQPVEIEPLHQCRCERARTIEKESPAVGDFGH